MSAEQNNIEKIFEIQSNFTNKIFAEKYDVSDISKISKEDLKRWSKEYILCASKELYEMLDEINWKTHRFLTKEDNIDNFIEEGIDAFKFLLNLMLLHGVTPEMFYNKFIEKSKIVDIRYEQEKIMQNIRKCEDKFVVIDIDGIINQYPSDFLNYCAVEGDNYSSVYEFKKQDIHRYKFLKRQYRITGQERKNTVNSDIYDVITKVKALNYKIILLTSRPYEKMLRLFFDTTFWLDDKKIQYDFIFFNKEKEQFIIDNFNKEQIVFCLDDQIDNSNKLCEHFKTYLMPNFKIYRPTETHKIDSRINIITNFNSISELCI